MSDSSLPPSQNYRHTPGPWVWWTSNSWRRLRGADDVSVLEPYVARDGHPDCSVRDADMRLIAAVPDLVEALECLLPGLVLDLRYAEPDDDKDALRNRIKTVTDALAKAYGSQQNSDPMPGNEDLEDEEENA